jgi:membrane protein
VADQTPRTGRYTDVDSRQTTRGLPASAWSYAIWRALHGFMRHSGIDSAAALSFFAALATLPACLTIVSGLALANGKADAVGFILEVVGEFAQPATVDIVRDPLEELLSLPYPGLGLAIGLVLTLWSVSSYSTAFGRAINKVYEIQEGRQFWKFRGLMMLVALFLMVVFGIIVAIIITTPTVTDVVAENMGIGEPWTSVWNIGKWPVLFVLACVVVAVLFYFSPNVRHPRLRWVSYGAMFSILAWALATAGFAVYVLNVARYDRVYGWLGGIVVLLIWLYITNLVLVLGAEIDAELVRVRQLRGGIHAEEVIQLSMRDTRRNLVLARQLASDVSRGRQLRTDADLLHETQPVDREAHR